MDTHTSTDSGKRALTLLSKSRARPRSACPRKCHHHHNLAMERTTGPDWKTRGDDATISVVRFAEIERSIEENSPWIGWAVTTKPSEQKKGADTFKVVVLPEYMTIMQARKSSILSSPYLTTGSSTLEEYKKGKPIISRYTPVRACVGKRRPPFLYRVVHDEHPDNGLWSRGFGTVKTDELSFMLHFDRHLKWRCRNPSPFMSTTTVPAKAANLADWYERHGFTNIQILVIKVDESSWQARSRIWDVRKTAARLGLHRVLCKQYHHDEYLIEDCIPAPCVTRIRWEDMKAEIDAGISAMRKSRKRKRSIFESDGPGDETVLSDGRSSRVWNVVKTPLRQKGTPYYYQIHPPK